MKHHEDGWISLELSEVIRVNQLVRGRINFNDFKGWYDSLPVSEQCALVVKLCEFAYQAGFDEEVYNEALSEANINPGDPLIVHAASVHKPFDLLLDLLGYTLG